MGAKCEIDCSWLAVVIPSGGDGRQGQREETDVIELLRSGECRLSVTSGAGEVADEAEVPAQPAVDSRLQRKVVRRMGECFIKQRELIHVIEELSGENECLGAPSPGRSAAKDLSSERLGAPYVGLRVVRSGE